MFSLVAPTLLDNLITKQRTRRVRPADLNAPDTVLARSDVEHNCTLSPRDRDDNQHNSNNGDSGPDCCLRLLRDRAAKSTRNCRTFHSVEPVGCGRTKAETLPVQCTF